MNAVETEQGPGQDTLKLGGLLIVALILRLARLEESWLWTDEAFGVNFATQSFFDMLIAELRWDIHPPLWYIQLWAWAQAGRSDSWFYLNSIAWSLLGIVVIYATASRVYDRRVGLIAAGLLTVLPASVMFARFVRMYPMLMAIAPLAWYFNYQYLVKNQTRGNWWGIALCELWLVYSHGIGIILLSYTLLYGAGCIVTRRATWTTTHRWLILQMAIVVLSAGSVANSMIRSVGHTSAPTKEEVLGTLAALCFGKSWDTSQVAGGIAAAIVLLLTLSALVFRRGRIVTFSYITAPIVVSLLVSYTLKPIWHLHALVFAAPLLCLGSAIAITNLVRWAARVEVSDGALARRAYAVAVPAGLVLLGLSIHHVTAYQKQTNYRWAADRLHQMTTAGDVVYVPVNWEFWGLAWYFAGPDWGSPLAVQDLELGDDRWGRELGKLSPRQRARLHLEPVTDHIEHEGVKLYVGSKTKHRLSAQQPPKILLVETWSGPAHGKPWPAIDGYALADKIEQHQITIYTFLRSTEPSDDKQ